MEVAGMKEQLAEFVSVAFEPNDVIEIRCLRTGEAQSQVITVDAICESAEWERLNFDKWNIYVGVNPRLSGTPGRKREDVALARCLVVDIDNVTPDEALQRLTASGLPYPSMGVSTGHGVHYYWRLTEPIHDLDSWTRYQKALIHRLNSDKSIHDPSRVMRLPGFVNHKPPEAMAQLLWANSRVRYPLSALNLHSSNPEHPLIHAASSFAGVSTDTIEHRATAYLKTCSPSISGQGGHDHAMWAARVVVYGFNLGVDRGLALLQREFNPGCIPPWSHEELRHKCIDADSKPFDKPRGWLLDTQTTTNSIQAEVSTPRLLTDQDSDLANGRRLVEQYRQDVRYLAEREQWLVWDKRRWAFDVTGQVDRFAKESSDRHLALAEKIADSKERRRKVQLATRARSNSRLKAAISIASTEAGIPCVIADLNQHHHLLNVANGTLDLDSGLLRPSQRSDLMTQLMEVNYDTSSCCPLWIAFLHQAMGQNEDLVQYLQRAVGYSLSGDVSEQVLFFCHGSGANGKSVFCNTLLRMLGADYSAQAHSELLTQSNSSRHPTEMADLYGRRMVVISETEQQCQLAEARVKQITGGDPIRARRMHEDFWQFNPTHKLWLTGNHKPTISGQDHGIWRRIHLIPWLVTIPDEQQDKTLPQKLESELPGILAWAVQGYQQWRAIGLQPPEQVINAVAEYRNEQDDLGNFLNERCERIAGHSIQAGKLKSAYEDYLHVTKPISPKLFAKAMRSKGFETKPDSKKCSVYFDLCLLQ